MSNKYEELKNQAESAFKESLLDKALELYAEAFTLEPEKPEAHKNLGNVYQALKNDEKAVEFYEKALDLDGSYWPVWNNLGILYKNETNFKKAKECLNKALKIVPEDLNLKSNYLNLLVDLKDKEEAKRYIKFLDRPEIERNFNISMVLARAYYILFEDFQKASVFYEEALKKDASRADEVLPYLIYSLYKAHQFERAIELSKNEALPFTSYSFHTLGRCFMAVKEYSLAIESLLKAYEDKELPGRDDVCYVLSQAYEHRKAFSSETQPEDVKNILKFAKEAVELNPEDADYYVMYGRGLLANNKPKKSLEAFEIAYKKGALLTNRI